MQDIITKYVLQNILRNMYADNRIMEDKIKASDADWTIMRPPRLTDGPATDKYRVAINAYLERCLTISRADVGHFMLDQIENEKTFKATIELAY
jgi:hypothetical protein